MDIFPISSYYEAIPNWNEPKNWKKLGTDPDFENRVCPISWKGQHMPWDEKVKRRLKLRDLDILMTVIQAGSMGKAADLLNIFQPTISKSIADLEHVLGVRLLDRRPQGVEPTHYARALIRRSAAAFNELKQGVQEIENLADPTAGELRIGGTEPMLAGLLPAVIDRLSRQYPRFVFHVARVSTDFRENHALRERELELVIGRVPRRMTENDLDVEILFDDPFVVAAGAQNPWARKRRVTLAELVDEPWVLPPPNQFISAVMSEIFQSCGLERPRNGVVCSALQMNEAMLATGRYLSIYSKSRLQLSGKRLSIKILPVELPAHSSRVGIVQLKNRTLRPMAEIFIKSLRTVAASLQKAS